MKAILFLITGLFFMSCQQQVALSDKSRKDSMAMYLLSSIEGFTLPFNKDFSDSNTLIFMRSPAFGTSSCIHFHKTNNIIHSVLYEVPPINRDGPGKYAMGFQDTLSFQGYAFKIDSLDWVRLTNKAARLLDYVPEGDHRCFDGVEYDLVYNNHIISGDDCRDSTFECFSRYIEDSLIKHHLKRR